MGNSYSSCEECLYSFGLKKLNSYSNIEEEKVPLKNSNQNSKFDSIHSEHDDIRNSLGIITSNLNGYDSYQSTSPTPSTSSTSSMSSSIYINNNNNNPSLQLTGLGPGLGIKSSTNSMNSSNFGTNSSKKQKQFHSLFELSEEIGVGSTSKCYKCYKKSSSSYNSPNNNSLFACKIIDKRQVELKFSGILDQFNIEISVLKSLNHPNIIKLIDSFETKDRIYMVMEHMEGGELFDYVVKKGTLSEEEASVIVRQIISAVDHMHNLNIIHRDLKPENLLLTFPKSSDGSTSSNFPQIKLIDFGLAKILNEEEFNVASSFLGTKGYLAPEMLQRHQYDKSIDMWALGVIVFVLLCGCLPFDDNNNIINEEDAKKMFILKFPKWVNNNLSVSAKDLLYKLLEINPRKRITASEALAHPWVSGKEINKNVLLKSPSILNKRREKETSNNHNFSSNSNVSSSFSPLPPDYIHGLSAKLHGNLATASFSYTNQLNKDKELNLNDYSTRGEILNQTTNQYYNQFNRNRKKSF